MCVWLGYKMHSMEDKVRIISGFNFSELPNFLSPKMGQSLRNKDFKGHRIYKLKSIF